MWIYDRRLVTVETTSEELRLAGNEAVQLYKKACQRLAESAEYGAVGTASDRPGEGVLESDVSNPTQLVEVRE
ncbi:hypothetical protein ACWGQ5_27840 [Streptomyces sp. NPDC055722]